MRFPISSHTAREIPDPENFHWRMIAAMGREAEGFA